MFEGLIELPIWGYVLVTLALTHITIASVTIFLHRAQAHRALDLHAIPSHFFRFWLWMTTGMVTKQWVAVHRKHHAKCETEDDPHSPQVLGIRKVLFEGAELYRNAARDEEISEKYGHGTPNDWLERKLYGKYNFLGIAFMALINIALFGPIGLTIWAVQMIWIPVWAAGVINGVGHYWGYRNYEAADASTNIVPIGILIGGEEMHNNHHAFPSSAKFSTKWWEFDIGWFYIRVLQALGLARVKKVTPKPVMVPAKKALDLETVRAVVIARLYVIADYRRTVVLPVLKEELRKADASCRRLFRQASSLLVGRDESQMDEADQTQLQAALKESRELETVYQFKLRLKEIWERSSATQEALLQALQDWCKQAEATGNKYLSDFAHSLRGYTLKAAAH